MGPQHLIPRIEWTWARDAAALVRVLAEQDPVWRSEAFELSSGYVVLSGVGLYVNQGLAVGISDPMAEADLARLIERSAEVGVPPAIDITPATHPETVALLALRGFRPSEQATSALVLEVAMAAPQHPGIEIVPVSDRSLTLWQSVSAQGWGHPSSAARRAADAYARAAHALDGDGMVIALDTDDGRPLGCASLTIRDGVATLGGMSTLPAERGRGVQSALIHHRITVATRAGCDLIAASAESGSASERNLIRHGFRSSHLKTLHVLRSR